MNKRKDELLELKCPHCGGNLIMTDAEHARCPYCDYRYLIDEAKRKTILIDIKDNTSENIRKTIKVLPVALVSLAVIALILVFVAFGDNIAAFGKRIFRLGHAPEEDAGRPLPELFCEDVFGKSYSKITKAELSSIKYLDIDSRYYSNTGTINTIMYSFHDYEEFSNEEEFQDTLKKWTYNTEYINDYLDSIDFTMFTGLTRVDLTKCNIISNLEFSRDSKIKYINTGHTLNEISSVINPENVKVLNIQYKKSDETGFGGIGKYSNLEEIHYIVSLAQAYEINVDVSELVQCKKLTKIHLQCGNTYTGTDKLKELENLKSIYIDNITFDECTFLKEMPQLEELSLKAGDEPELSGLENMINLKKLYFWDGKSIDENKLLPLTKLEELKVSFVGAEGLEVLAKLKNLKVLSFQIQNGNFREIMDVSPLAGLQNLQTVNITFYDTFNFCAKGIEDILNMPSLQTITMAPEISSGFALLVNTEELVSNSSVKLIQLKGCYVYDENTQNVSDYQFLKNYPNVKSLYLLDAYVSNIDFVAQLQALELISLCENKIASYEPLSECKRLKTLCVTRSKLSNKNKEEISLLPESLEVVYDE